MGYRLYYQDQIIGNVTLLEKDFPSLFGTYELYSLAKENPVTKYINYSVEASQLMNEDEAKWEMFVEREEPKFIDLIESDGWKLVDKEGKTHRILIPNFCDNHEIVWRWRP